VLGLAAGARRDSKNARGFRLAHALAGVSLDCLCGRKTGWPAFGHDKDEYEAKPADSEDGRGLERSELLMAGPAGSGTGCGPDLEHGRMDSMGLAARELITGRKIMDEREFFNETTEQRTHSLTCPKCGQAAEYKVTWMVRRKRAQVPRGADERDRARFAKAQSYMVRRDDKLQCANIRCRKPFEITTLQSLAFLMD